MLKTLGPRSVVCIAVCVFLIACSGAQDRSPGTVVDVDGLDVFAVVRDPTGNIDLGDEAPTLLFLHGASFTAEVWIETGILDQTAAAGFRSSAVDLPGFGETASSEIDRGDFLAALIDQVDNGSGVVLISPSMSGGWSLDLIASGRDVAVRGFVPVAPVGIDTFVGAIAEPVATLPTLIVWGADDDVIDPDRSEALAAALPTSDVKVMSDAGHAAYKDQPDEFVELLIDFASSL